MHQVSEQVQEAHEFDEELGDEFEVRWGHAVTIAQQLGLDIPQVGGVGRSCLWCGGAICPRSRRDTLYCGQSHRQAAHRFHTAARGGTVHQLAETGPPGRRDGSRSPGATLRFAYADPPYPGLSARYYSQHQDFAGEVDHAALLRTLADQYDGWALSTSAAALQDVLALAPRGSRVGAWFRGGRGGRSYAARSAWEPVIYYGARHDASLLEARRLDALVYVSRPRTTDPRRVIGAKPAAFCHWLFGLLGMRAGDVLDDVFPGSGRVSEAWATFEQHASPEA